MSNTRSTSARPSDLSTEAVDSDVTEAGEQLASELADWTKTLEERPQSPAEFAAWMADQLHEDLTTYETLDAADGVGIVHMTRNGRTFAVVVLETKG